MTCIAEDGIFAHGAADAPGPELEAEGDQAGAESLQAQHLLSQAA